MIGFNESWNSLGTVDTYLTYYNNSPSFVPIPDANIFYPLRDDGQTLSSLHEKVFEINEGVLWNAIAFTASAIKAHESVDDTVSAFRDLRDNSFLGSQLGSDAISPLWVGPCCRRNDCRKARQ